MKRLEKKLEFQKNDRIGYICTQLENCGTGFRASIMVHLPKLGGYKSKEQKDRILKRFNSELIFKNGKKSLANGNTF